MHNHNKNKVQYRLQTNPKSAILALINIHINIKTLSVGRGFLIVIEFFNRIQDQDQIIQQIVLLYTVNYFQRQQLVATPGEQNPRLIDEDTNFEILPVYGYSDFRNKNGDHIDAPNWLPKLQNCAYKFEGMLKLDVRF